jgi:HK97 family phage portal protein
MSLFDNILARMGYTKQERRPAGDPIGAAARANEWALPDPSVYGNQADLMARVSYIYTAVSLTAQAAAAEHGGVYRIRGEKKRAIDNHLLEQRILAPNPWQTQMEFLKAHYAYMLLNGNSYWWLNATAENAMPGEIWVIPPSMITPRLDERLGVAYYEYDPGDGQVLNIPNWQIVHFKDFHPTSMFIGLSRVEPIAKVATGDIKTVDYLSRIYGDNSGRLPGVLAFKSPIDDDIWKRIKGDIRDASKNNNYMLLRGVGDGGVDLMNAAATVKEMEIWQGRAMTREDIFNVFAPGLYNMIAVNATEANSKTGKQTFSEFTLFPMLTGTAQKITQRIMPKYGPNLIYEFDDPRQVDRALEMQEVAVFAQFHTVNEVREKKFESDPLDDERGEMLVSQITPNAGIEAEEEEAPVNNTPPMLPAEITPEAQEEEPGSVETNADAMPDDAENEMADELMKWEKYERAGKSAKREFAPQSLPAALVARIRYALKSGRDIDAVFANAGQELPVIILARSIERLANGQSASN